MQNGLDNPLAPDLEFILRETNGLFEELRGKRLFITGGTGFFGSWLLESLAWANEKLGLDVSALVLTRDPGAFRKSAPHLAENPAIRFHPGDIRTFRFPEGEFSHIIHAAATSAMATFNREDPLAKFDTVVEGTRHTLDFAVRCKARKLLLTSSGAVYGKQPPLMSHVSEDYPGAPDTAEINAVWGESKRAAEYLCAYYADRYGIGAKIARCFSFVGPYLQFDVHYAVGNFIRDGLNGGPIRVNGDGTPCRSYLYAADLAVWLWTILFRGEPRRPYNVGSEKSISIGELAGAVARCFPNVPAVNIAKSPVSGSAPERYVPSTARARTELGLREAITLDEAIRRTISHAMSHTNERSR
ncbi:MAG: NAD-dependent epimerase/dehydratase family protein [Desulfobacteraceae bacterium]|nr:NAD-dependent epimerase/dehydratase family protein [Desulfobacteraceae bacterium]